MAAPSPSPTLDVAARISELEARVARLEALVGEVSPAEAVNAPKAAVPARDFEFEVGQKWFARFGIVALAVGGGFMLTLPYPGVLPVLPAATGFVVALGLFGIAHAGRTRFALATAYLRGAAMALLYCAALRLSFFGQAPVLPPGGTGAHLVLGAAAALNLWIAWRRQSPVLAGLALLTAAATPLVLGTATTVLVSCVVLAGLTAFVGSRRGWGGLLPFGALVTYAAYTLWAMGGVVLGHPYHWVSEPANAPLVLLLAVTILAAVPLWTEAAADDVATALAALINSIVGYGLFLLHTYAVGAANFAPVHGFAAAVFLWLAASLWLRCRSQIATFFYAMAGYAALTVAIARLSSIPNVFVWLSLESVVVVATAIWFRSRFIVVANFVIYAVVVLGYILLNERETGVSIGFGLVALVSARILNWQRHRLALQTDLMRNAYLVSAFTVFPYALYHLTAPRYAALAWVALAVAYYALNFVIRNQKYRWMGHGTLLLTTVYLLVPTHPGMTPALRISSFLAVGAALLAVSLVFTQSRRNPGP